MKNKCIAILTGVFLAVFCYMQPAMSAETYGPTAARETLWSIASCLRPTYAVSTQQMMLAIRAKNPQAFNNPNINSLKKGFILKIPTLAEIQRLNRVQALHIARQHNRNWNSPPARTAPPRPASSAFKTSSGNRQAKARLQREVSTLRQQLSTEQRHSTRLSARIKALESAQQTAGSTSPQELKKLQAQVADLKASLDEKNTHIRNLQVSLKEASDTIKRQYAESQMLYDKLKSADPGSLPAPPSVPDTSPKLTLSGVGNDGENAGQSAEPAPPATPQTRDGKPAVFTDQLPATQQNAAANTGQASTAKPAAGQKNGVPLKTLLEQQAAQLASGTAEQEAPPAVIAPPSGQQAPASSTPDGNTPSRLSFAVALISLLFILALLWRAFSQQRSLRREATERTPSGTEVIPPPTAPDTTETDPKVKADGRQEPDILL